MSGAIRFEEERVLKFFLEKGMVATMRRAVQYYSGLIGKVIEVCNGSGKAVAKARVVAIFENSPETRKMLVKYSGFSSVEEWESVAKQLHGNLPPIIVLLKK